MYQTTEAPRGVARRDAILRAAIKLVGEEGPDALTHRAVAERAGVAVSATTYWFSSKEEIFREAVALAASEEVERLERLVLDLAPRHVTPAGWAHELSAALAADFEEDPARPVAMFEFVLQASREPSLRPEVERFDAAHLRLAEAGLRAAGSDDPETDARLVVATITGLMLEQVTTPHPHFERAILRPALERLFTRLAP